MYIARPTCTVLLYTTVPLLPSTVSPIFLQFQHDYFLFSLCTHPKKQPTEEERKKERNSTPPQAKVTNQETSLFFLSFFLSLHHVTQSSKILNIEFSIQYSLRKDRERGRGREGGREE